MSVPPVDTVYMYASVCPINRYPLINIMEPENQDNYSLFDLILALFEEKNNIMHTRLYFVIKKIKEAM
jgi:hypothetical protein